MHPLSKRIIDAAPRRLRQPVEVAVGTVDHAITDRLPGLAAEIAFWLLLSLPALILTVVAAFGMVGERLGPDWEEQLTERVVELTGFVLTASAIENAVLPLLEQLLTGGGLGVVSIGFVTALWTASRAMKVVLQTLTLVADAEAVRDGWKDRLLGFAITLGAMVAGVVLAPLLLTGPGFGEQIARWAGGDPVGFGALWRNLYWPVVVLVATLAVGFLYHLGIPGRISWRRELPGAILATGVWLLGSGALRLYGSWFLTTESIYGPLAGPIVGLLWVWLSGFAVLFGAELNAALRRQRDRTNTTPPAA